MSSSRNDSFSSTRESAHHILIIGCAFGGITALVNLVDLIAGTARPVFYPGPDFKGTKASREVRITVIDERDGYFYAVGAPLAHVSATHTASMYKRFSRLREFQHPNVEFLHGRVTALDPVQRVASWVDGQHATRECGYDYVLVATGLKRSWPAVPAASEYEGYLRDARAFIRRIAGDDGLVATTTMTPTAKGSTTTTTAKPRKIVVIGAGAVGIEFAGEIKLHYTFLDVVLIHSRDQVLSSEPLPDDVKERVGTMIREEGVELILGERATITEPSDENEQYKIFLSKSHTTIEADFVIDATKKGSPTTDFLSTGEYLNDEQEIKVKPNLSFDSQEKSNRERHFGAGDVVAWSGIKRAGNAMVMGQTAAINIWASILNSEKDKDCAEEEFYKHSCLETWPAVIGIAIGKQCLLYDPKEGVKWGEDVMKNYFGDDLGWSGSLKYLNLIELDPDAVVDVAGPLEKLEIVDHRPQEISAEA